MNIKYKIFITFLFIFFGFNLSAKNITIEVIGNEYTDTDVIYSLLENKPESINSEYSNYLLKQLNQSGLFNKVRVEMNSDKYIVFIEEYSNINKIYYRHNKRLKDEELDLLVNELNFINLNPNKIKIFKEEVTKIYKSFGYNQIKIDAESEINKQNNTAVLYFNFQEGKITKIKNVYFVDNKIFDDDILKSEIKSKNKSLKNLFANNNFKIFQIESDVIRIENFYKNNGFRDVKVSFDVEYEVKKNKAIIYFRIYEGIKYKFRLIDYENLIINSDDNSSVDIDSLLQTSSKLNNQAYNNSVLNNLKSSIADILDKYGYNFFEINTLEKIENEFVDIRFQILSTEPKYVNKINIEGNTRTLDTVIRRELSVGEGDPISDQQIKEINKKLNRLDFFKSVKLDEIYLEDNLINLEIQVEEKQTGVFQAGLSFGSLEGATFITGLKEKNIGGTGRSLNFLVNTSENNTEYSINTTDPFFLNSDVDLNYGLKYHEKDLSKSQSYKLNEFSINSGIKYDYLKNLQHNVNLNYKLKDYIVTDKDTVSSSILNSQGESANINLDNILTYSTLNSFLRPSKGNFLQFSNTVQTPTSSNNGYIKNLITYKKFINKNKNIFSFQTKIGNIFSLQNKEILTDEKFSLGGRWLRGFDIYGAGPRESVTSYIGGKNLIVTKFDYSRPVNENSDTPIYLNFFNDYGLVWSNKSTPTNSDNSLRGSYGFGIKFYSAVGPIGFTWGFPIMDKEYDIKRMFMFQIGYID